MRRWGILTIVAALAFAGGAEARGLSGGRHRPAMHLRRPHLGRVSHRRSHRLHAISQSSVAASAAAPVRTYAANDVAGAAGQPGWFKSDHEAGWGMRDGGTRTVVGLYQRPAQPGIPGPQIYHDPEGRGAAGLSLSLKLGQ